MKCGRPLKTCSALTVKTKLNPPAESELYAFCEEYCQVFDGAGGSRLHQPVQGGQTSDSGLKKSSKKPWGH